MVGWSFGCVVAWVQAAATPVICELRMKEVPKVAAKAECANVRFIAPLGWLLWGWL